jgi:spore maturation protein CgeB
VAGPLRYLWCHSATDAATADWHRNLLARRRERGFAIEHFCVTPPELGPRWLHFPDLDRRWRAGEPRLLAMYERLAEAIAGCDVLVHFNGANLHPRFMEQVRCRKIYVCADDPESSEILSRPVAYAYDLQLVQNIACVDLYRSWGLRNVRFWPLGSQLGEERITLTDEQILDPAARPVPVIYHGERNDLRRARLDALQQAFPAAICRGHGWPAGYADEAEPGAAYQRARIGWNVHNSTGPVNFRTYDLPAHGVLQICDNRTHLGGLFAPGEEVVGFDTIAEAIALTHHYLAHPHEQRRIALAGHRRWRQDYSPDRIWDPLVGHAEELHAGRDAVQASSPLLIAGLATHHRRTRLRRMLWRGARLAAACGLPLRLGARLWRRLRQPRHPARAEHPAQERTGR